MKKLALLALTIAVGIVFLTGCPTANTTTNTPANTPANAPANK